MVDAPEIFCAGFCMCIVFTLPSSKTRQLEKELGNKEYHNEYKSELKKTKLKVAGKIDLGIHAGDKEKRRFIIELKPDDLLSERDFEKIFPIFQKKVKALEKKFGLKRFSGMTCTRFSFSSNKFKPLGELGLPANLTLRTEWVEKVGEAELHGFKIAFKKSPIGMERAYVELVGENLLVTTVSSYEFAQIENIVNKTFVHAKELANLFVEEIGK